MRMPILLSLVPCLLASPSAASVIARVLAPAVAQQGTSFDVELRASLSEPTIGWGLDLAFDPAVLQLAGAPALGGDWLAFSAPDGDGLAGIYFPEPGGTGLAGDDVLLATLHFEAIALGATDLLLSATLADLSEGFALELGGFDSVVFEGGHVQVVPEPGTALLCAFGLAGLALRRRPRAGA